MLLVDMHGYQQPIGGQHRQKPLSTIHLERHRWSVSTIWYEGRMQSLGHNEKRWWVGEGSCRTHPGVRGQSMDSLNCSTSL